MQQLYEMVLGLAETLNTSYGAEMAKAIKARDWQALKQVEVPMDLCPESFWQHTQVRDLLLKVEGLPGMPTEQELKDSCLGEFYSCEAQNKLTNDRLKIISWPSHLLDGEELRLKEFLQKVKNEIRGLLGPLPDIQDIRARFGPGATFCRRFPHVNLAEKLDHAPSYTIDAWPYLLDWVGTAWGKCVYRVSDNVWPGGVTPSRYSGTSRTDRKSGG